MGRRRLWGPGGLNRKIFSPPLVLLMVDFTQGSNIMKLESSSSRGAEDGEMSANILLIEYEPRYVERVQKALESSA